MIGVSIYSFSYIYSTCVLSNHLFHILIKVLLCPYWCVRLWEYCRDNGWGLFPNRAHSLWKDCLFLGESLRCRCQGPEGRWGMRVEGTIRTGFPQGKVYFSVLWGKKPNNSGTISQYLGFGFQKQVSLSISFFRTFNKWNVNYRSLTGFSKIT